MNSQHPISIGDPVDSASSATRIRSGKRVLISALILGGRRSGRERTMACGLAPLLAGVWLVFVSCRTAPTPVMTRPEARPATRAESFFPEKLAAMDRAIAQAIESKRLPGGVLWLERDGARYVKAYGQKSLVPNRAPMIVDTIFDAASLTKVVATTPSIMRLVEAGRIEIDAPVSRYLPEFGGSGKEPVTIRHLLTHTSGLRPGLSPTPPWNGYDRAITLACAEKVTAEPGTVFRYSDINFIVLGEIVRRVSGLSLAEFSAREIFQPLGMRDTAFLPAPAKLDRIAPTEKEGDTVLHGVVHDPTARRMGGVAGHAGLFTTASDLARFARMLLNEGQLDRVRLFRAETVRRMTAVQSPEAVSVRRGLGWDIDSAYAGPRGEHFPVGSYGHTGWTGTSIWIDPYSRTFILFLSNRNHPTEEGSVIALRRQVGTLAAEAIIGFNFAYVPGALPARPAASTTAANAASTRLKTTTILNGIDGLVKTNFAPLRGLRLGLITNHTGHDRDRNATIDLLRKASGVRLVALFSPEHGIRGQLDEKVSDSIDEQTGLPIFSLYGATRKPTPDQLRNLDALVFDIQDIGARFYTYISTLGLAMEAAAQAHLHFFVLDRVNPINGLAIDGPVAAGPSTFTAYHNIPVRHGLTVGELARLFQAERHLPLQLTVIPLAGWTRDLLFDQTELPWTNPSPNMRSLTEAFLYPGIGLLETTSLSVGRGTDTPFEVIGAPYINDQKLAAELNRRNLGGVRFVPVRFTPKASVFKDNPCGGVNIVVIDRAACNSIDVGIAIAQTLHRLYPSQFGLDRFNQLLVHKPTVDAIRAGKTLDEIKALWTNDLDAFKKRREQFLIYR